MDQSKIDALRALPVSPRSHLIDGKQVFASDGGMMDILSPIDGQVLTQMAKGTAADMHAAITAARAAFEDRRWAGQAPAARKKVLLKWADLIDANALELAVLGVRDNGTEISMALKAEPGSAAGTIRYYAEALDKIYGEIAATPSDVLGMIHKENFDFDGNQGEIYELTKDIFTKNLQQVNFICSQCSIQFHDDHVFSAIQFFIREIQHRKAF